MSEPTVEPVVTPRGAPVGRRLVLGMVGLGAVGVLTGRWLNDQVASAVGATVPGLASVIPAAGGFRIYTVTGGYPATPEGFRVTVTGMVDRELALSMSDLAAMPQTGITRDFQCVTGWRVNDVPWAGVQLKEVLAQCGVEPGAAALRFTSFDGAYTESLTMEQAMKDEVLVATHMYGEPLKVAHGAPVRLYVVPMYGYKSIKWLSGIEVGRTVIPGYWQQRGYDIDAYIGASNGRSDDPNVA